MATHFEQWQKEWTRNVTKFGNLSNNNTEITFDIPFYLFGLQIYAYAHRKVKRTWHCSDLLHEPSYDDLPASERQTIYYFIDGTVRLQSFLTFEDNSTKTLDPFIMTGEVDHTYVEEGIPTKNLKKVRLLNENKKIKKIKIKNLDTDLGIEIGSYNYYQYKQFNEWHWAYWFYKYTIYSEFKIFDLEVYEQPKIDSGMRIKGDGKIYKPAETLFPSPLRIYHNRIRNIMLVPKGCDYASVFKIKTEQGEQAITTLID